MTVKLKIGPLYVWVDCPEQFPWTDEVAIFRTEDVPQNTAQVFYTLELTQEFAPLWGKMLYDGPQLTIMEVGGLEHRIYYLPGSREPFALSRRMDDTHVHLWIDQRARHALKWDRNLLGLLSLEHDCLLGHAFLLHASFVIQNGQAIIFTAPSGSGKSTQADLWHKYAGAQIINGDRTLVFQENGTWYAGGFPVCGSSLYCLNQSAPVAAVVCLEKYPENQALQIGPLQAMNRVYSQAFVNRWSAEDCRRICDMVLDLSAQVKVFHYQCTKEPDAVAYLNNLIFPTERKEGI